MIAKEFIVMDAINGTWIHEIEHEIEPINA